MTDAASGAHADRYRAGVTRAQAEAERLGARSRLLSNLRGLSFGTALLSGIAGFAAEASRGLSFTICGLAVLAFATFVVLHGRILEVLDLAERRVDVYQSALLRLAHAWDKLPDVAEGLAPNEHPYSGDLDLFGSGSLFQRLSVARTRFGRERLAGLLLEADPNQLDEIQARQAAVQELAQAHELREEFEAHALGVAGKTGAASGAPRVRLAPNPTQLLSWAESEPELLNDPASVWGVRILPPLTLAALVAWLGFGLTFVPALGLLFLQGVILMRAQRAASRVFNAVSVTEGAFLRYSELLRILERAKFEAPALRALVQRLDTPVGLPSSAMTRFRRWAGWFDLRHNGLVYPVVDLVLLWDVWCTLGLERWQRAAGKHLRGWFEVIGWFEAYSSLASFASDEPGVSYPELARTGTEFRAEQLAHPLIDPARRVANDVLLGTEQRALLVTGSNMSGKSTLLRAMGLNAVLAFAGAPVTARRLRLSPIAVRTSIRVADSLERGVSHFYAEIVRLKGVVDSASNPTPVLFLLDEILHGTNSRERQVGARWVLTELLAHGAIGAISTHDEELCRLPPHLMQSVALVHLRESVQGGAMHFDYKVYPGPVTSGNALRLMRVVGLQVPLE
ncbi:MAG TPA: MutS family DNA mismatch repair protein [Polyangiaceae bacterium]|nr:MutS family DNA mismatch repair protein [Polyangiaceae bacterium]